MENFEKLVSEQPLVKQMQRREEVFWVNPQKTSFAESMEDCELNAGDVEDAQQRLLRFAPLIEKYFPETKPLHGLIESPLVEINAMKDYLNEKYGAALDGRLFLKEDSHLAIAGSVKARGGIYEVLNYTEKLARDHGFLGEGESYEKLGGEHGFPGEGENYEKLGEEEVRRFLNGYTIQVGSTGNLGLSIGIISAVLGYKVIVHMSADAKQWKKELLRSHGVVVKEYEGDYGEAVKKGRELSDADPHSYFIDDENSRTLFLGYATAGERIKKQFHDKGIVIDEKHPLFVYIPCGVGGAPGGISFGLKQVFKDAVHCFFVEPVQAPCMLLGMATGLNHEISVQDIGLSGKTHADGLAVGRPSGFVGTIMKKMFSGGMTVRDYKLYEYMRDLLTREDIFLEPSACAAFQGPVFLNRNPKLQDYIRRNGLENKMQGAVHVVWATGGSLVPEDIREEYIHTKLPE